MVRSPFCLLGEVHAYLDGECNKPARTCTWSWQSSVNLLATVSQQRDEVRWAVFICRRSTRSRTSVITSEQRAPRSRRKRQDSQLAVAQDARQREHRECERERRMRRRGSGHVASCDQRDQFDSKFLDRVVANTTVFTNR